MKKLFKCINNYENMFCILDTKDGVCEWTSIQDCRKYLEGGIIIEGLSLKRLDRIHKYLDYTPVANFVPNSIALEIRKNSANYNEIFNVVKSYMLGGGNILSLRRESGSYSNFISNLARWCNDG